MTTETRPRLTRSLALAAVAMAAVLSPLAPNGAAWAQSAPPEPGPILLPDEEEAPPSTQPTDESGVSAGDGSGPPSPDSSSPTDNALADSFVPAWFLFSISTGQYGPCRNQVGTYEGEYYVPRYHYSTGIGKVYYYRTVYLGSKTTSNNKYFYYREEGFTTAYRYHGCYSGAPARGYYGAKKASRSKTLTRVCWSGGCNAGTWSYGQWRNGW
jgi:hypothetical protein